MNHLVKRLALYGAALMVAAGLGLGGRWLIMGPDAHVRRPASTPVPSGAVIGGPFTLTDGSGRAIGDADFRGRFMAIYFGFTYCPDACPTALTALSDALDLLGPAAEKVVPIFISVDPERDTPARMADYVRHFHPRLVGLTGSPEAVAAVARAYRVYYAKVQEKGAAAEDYTIDHTSIIYVMGPDGQFITHIPGHTTSPEAMARRLRELL